MHARVVLGVGKGVLFRAVSSVQECPHRERGSTVQLHHILGGPSEGYGSVLPRHTSDHGKRHLVTTHATDYQFSGELSPSKEEREVCVCVCFAL